jgi:DNA-directed RNA polymerase specialized sigma24 family protein
MAEDIASESWVAAFKALGRFDAQRAPRFRAWLTGVVKNEVAKAEWKARRHPVRSLEELREARGLKTDLDLEPADPTARTEAAALARLELADTNTRWRAARAERRAAARAAAIEQLEASGIPATLVVPEQMGKIIAAGRLPSPGEVAEAAWAIAHMPRRRRTALVLQAEMGLSQAEIAEAMGITRGAAKNLLDRGRDAVRAALGVDHPHRARGADRAAQVHDLVTTHPHMTGNELAAALGLRDRRYASRLLTRNRRQQRAAVDVER